MEPAACFSGKHHQSALLQGGPGVVPQNGGGGEVSLVIVDPEAALSIHLDGHGGAGGAFSDPVPAGVAVRLDGAVRPAGTGEQLRRIFLGQIQAGACGQVGVAIFLPDGHVIAVPAAGARQLELIVGGGGVRDPVRAHIAGNGLGSLGDLGRVLRQGEVDLRGVRFRQGQEAGGGKSVPGGLHLRRDLVFRQPHGGIIAHGQNAQPRQRTEGFLIEIGLPIGLRHKGQKGQIVLVPEGPVRIVGKYLRGHWEVEVGQCQLPVRGDVHAVLGGGGTIVAGKAGHLGGHGGGLGVRQGGDGLVHGDAVLPESLGQQAGGGQLIVGRGTAGGEHGGGHAVLGQHDEPRVVAQGVATLHQSLDAVLGEGEEGYTVPAETVAEKIQRVVRPDAPVVLRPRHGLAGGGREQGVVRQCAAEGRQVRGGGVQAAGAHGVEAVLGKGAGVASGVGLGEKIGVKVVAGGKGALQAGGLQDVLAHILHEILTADSFHDQLGQGEAVIAVDAVCAGIGHQTLGGEGFQQIVHGGVICVVKQNGAGETAAHEAGGVVEQHPHGDVPVAGIRHAELGQIAGDGDVQRHVALLGQLQDGHGGVDLADGADAIEDVIRKGPVLRLGVNAAAAGEEDLPVFPEGILHAGGAAVFQRGQRGGDGGILQRGDSAVGLGGQRRD